MKDKVRFVSVTSERAWNMFRCPIRHLVDRGRLVQDVLESDVEVFTIQGITAQIILCLSW